MTGQVREEVASLSMVVCACYWLSNYCRHSKLHSVEPFEDEIHPRLRYAHRGLVGMANNGTKDSNDSQFFVTLGMQLYIERSSSDLTCLQTGRMNYMENIRSLDAV